MYSEMELKLVAMVGDLHNEVNKLKQELQEVKRQQRALEARLGSSAAVPEASGPIVSAVEEQAGDERMSLPQIRDYIKSQLLARNPELTFTNGNRRLGKLTISDGRRNIERVLIRTSKSHRVADGYPSGWITLHESQLDKYELFLFVVIGFDGALHVLVMTQAELADWKEGKLTDSSGNYHFYLNQMLGRWLDDRDGLNYDCTRFYNAWGTVQRLLEN